LREGELLNIPLTYAQMASSIGISYEECARLFKQLKGVINYRRGGKIIIQDWEKLTNLS
jgi:CRP-like cAMP-binding protein